MKNVKIQNFVVGNERPMTLIGGVNVIESRDMVMRVAESFAETTRKLGMPYVFKASFDKANRSSIRSFRGPGIDEGLKILAEVKSTFGLPLITDIHAPEQAAPAAEVCDVLQIPAFLARQTDLLTAAAQTGAVINVKKPQFMSPPQIGNLVEKLRDSGNDNILLCERGANFGYDNLVVDMLGFRVMRDVSGDAPLILDATHALQMRESGAAASGGRRRQLADLARAGLAVGIAGLFIEAHPDPDHALCDGPSALPLDLMPAFLAQMKSLDDLVKSLPPLEIR